MFADRNVPCPAQHMPQSQRHNYGIIKLAGDRHKVGNEINRQSQIEN